jgi:CheY-like chemotaxis protein
LNPREIELMNQATCRRVVIADDNDDMRAVLRGLVEGLGAEVSEAASGGDLAILLAEDDRAIDLLVTDVRMPWATGVQVALSARNAGLTMPIIVITAFGDDRLRDEVKRLGAATLLPKPFRAEEFLSLARSYLSA